MTDTLTTAECFGRDELMAENARLREALKLTYSRVPDDKAQDLGFVEALLNPSK